MSKLVLQLYENEIPLTRDAVGRVITGLDNDQLYALCNAKGISRRCDNKNHYLYNKCVGTGICLARKYKRLFSFIDPICSSCDSKIITEALNDLFTLYYDGKYRAEWRYTREYKKDKEKVIKKRGRKPKYENELVFDAPPMADAIPEPAEPIRPAVPDVPVEKKKVPKPPRKAKSIVATETGRATTDKANESNIPKEAPKIIKKKVTIERKPIAKKGERKKS